MTSIFQDASFFEQAIDAWDLAAVVHSDSMFDGSARGASMSPTMSTSPTVTPSITASSSETPSTSITPTATASESDKTRVISEGADNTSTIAGVFVAIIVVGALGYAKYT